MNDSMIVWICDVDRYWYVFCCPLFQMDRFDAKCSTNDGMARASSSGGHSWVLLYGGVGDGC